MFYLPPRKRIITALLKDIFHNLQCLYVQCLVCNKNYEASKKKKGKWQHNKLTRQIKITDLQVLQILMIDRKFKIKIINMFKKREKSKKSFNSMEIIQVK